MAGKMTLTGLKVNIKMIRNNTTSNALYHKQSLQLCICICTKWFQGLSVKVYVCMKYYNKVETS